MLDSQSCCPQQSPLLLIGSPGRACGIYQQKAGLTFNWAVTTSVWAVRQRRVAGNCLQPLVQGLCDSSRL